MTSTTTWVLVGGGALVVGGALAVYFLWPRIDMDLCRRDPVAFYYSLPSQARTRMMQTWRGLMERTGLGSLVNVSDAVIEQQAIAVMRTWTAEQRAQNCALVEIALREAGLL